MASKTIDFNTFKDMCQRKEFPRLVLLTGAEDYYTELAVKHLRKNCLSEGAEQMDYAKLDFDSKNFDMDKVLENVMLPPWLSVKRVILVRNSGIFGIADPKKEFSDSFAKFAANIPETSVVVFWEDSADKRKKALWSVFEKEGISVVCDRLTEAEIAGKISQSLARYKITIDDEAATSLISRCDTSMRAVVNEFNKLALYCMEKKISNIDIGVVEKLCMPDLRGSIFNMLDAVSSGDCQTALCVVDELIGKKEPVARIKFMFCKHLSQLICAKELKNKDEIVRSLKVHPFTAKKLAAQAPKFSMEKLLNLFSACTKSDYDNRTGKLEERQSLEILIVLACKSLT